jgi:uncharacterized membrane protein YczE
MVDMGRELLRVFRLFLGLFLYALGIVLTMKAHIGFAPWEVFHAGIGTAIGMSIGNVSILAGLAIGLIALIMGERLGAGTICNMVFIGIFIDLLLSLGIIPEMRSLVSGLPLLVSGLFTIAVASYFYISSGYGAGPRDSLMVALTKRTHLPIGLCRGGLESLAVLIGWLLGGMVGIGTVVSALIIGFCVQITFKLLRFDPTVITHEDLACTWRRLRTLSATCPRV